MIDNKKIADKDNQIQSGHLTPIDSGIVQILRLLAQDRIYTKISFGHILPTIQAIHEKRYLAAVKNGEVCGVIIYVTISQETARRCIDEKRQCQPNEVNPNGTDIFMIAIAGTATKWLIRDFIRRFKGRVLLYERHKNHDQQFINKGLGWIDRKGVIRGSALE